MATLTTKLEELKDRLTRLLAETKEVRAAIHATRGNLRKQEAAAKRKAEDKARRDRLKAKPGTLGSLRQRIGELLREHTEGAFRKYEVELGEICGTLPSGEVWSGWSYEDAEAAGVEDADLADIGGWDFWKDTPLVEGTKYEFRLYHKAHDSFAYYLLCKYENGELTTDGTT